MLYIIFCFEISKKFREYEKIEKKKKKKLDKFSVKKSVIS